MIPYLIHWLPLLFLLYPAAADLRQRSFALWPVLATWAGGEIVLLTVGAFNPLSATTGLLPGACLLLGAYVTRGQIASGDGLILLLLGSMTGAAECLVIMMYAFFLAGLAGLLLILFRRADRKSRLPLVPFLLIVTLIRLSMKGCV